MRRGEVVEIDWHFSDLTGSKRRPAVVVQADFLNALIDDTILVKITSKRYGISGTEVEIDPTTETASGLSKVCYASCKDVLTRDQEFGSNCAEDDYMLRRRGCSGLRRSRHAFGKGRSVSCG
jgi:mRNA-degrading endonuclease toxin of MazEF toxin-antitoxin module